MTVPITQRLLFVTSIRNAIEDTKWAFPILGGCLLGYDNNKAGYSPLEVDRIWLWVYYNKIPIYLIFYLLKGDYSMYRGPSYFGQLSFAEPRPSKLVLWCGSTILITITISIVTIIIITIITITKINMQAQAAYSLHPLLEAEAEDNMSKHHHVYSPCE